MNRKRTIAIALIVGMLALTAAVVARMPFKNPKVAEELGLTSDQQQRLETLHFQHRRGQMDLRHQKQMKVLEIEEEMAKDNPDPAVLDRLIEEAGAVQIRLKKAQVRNLLAVKEILTTEQWEKAKGRLMQKMGKQGRRGRGGRGRGEGRGMGRGPGGGEFSPPGDLPPDDDNQGY